MSEAIAEIGHNQTPLPDRLAADYEDNLLELTRLAREADAAPKIVTSDDELNSIGDLIKRVQKLAKDLEAYRVREKEPYLAGGRAVDGFFKTHGDRAARITSSLGRRNEDFLRAKRDEERRRREEEARIKREEEQTRLREAMAMEEAARRAEAQARRIAAQADVDEKAKRDAEEAATRAQREAQRTLDEAAIAEERARKADEEAQAKAAELARTRGAESTSTLRTEWKGEIEDRETLDLEALRPFIKDDALQTAVNAFVRAGRRTLRGARIFQTDRLMTK